MEVGRICDDLLASTRAIIYLRIKTKSMEIADESLNVERCGRVWFFLCSFSLATQLKSLIWCNIRGGTRTITLVTSGRCVFTLTRLMGRIKRRRHATPIHCVCVNHKEGWKTRKDHSLSISRFNNDSTIRLTLWFYCIRCDKLINGLIDEIR